MAEKYISDEKAIKDILDIGQRMYYAGFAAANDGNISVRTGKKRSLDYAVRCIKRIYDRRNACKDRSRWKCNCREYETIV